MSGQALFLAGRFTWQGHPFNPEDIVLVFTYIAAINIIFQMFLMKRLTSFFSEEKLLAAGFLLMGNRLCPGVGPLFGGGAADRLSDRRQHRRIHSSSY